MTEKKLICPKCKNDTFDRVEATSVNIFIDDEDKSLRDDITSSCQYEFTCSECGYNFDEENIEVKLIKKQNA